MTAVAAARWGLVFWRHQGRSFAAITGPESKTSTAPVPEGAAFVGIEFALGTSLRTIPTSSLVDGGVGLPDTARKTFRLDSTRWEIPGADDAEALVASLTRSEVVVRDPVVAEILAGRRPATSVRTAERRFQATTGLSRTAIRQIERVREAAALLSAGGATADVISKLDYYDEPHLARALRRYVGRTARQLREGSDGAIALDLDQPTTS